MQTKLSIKHAQICSQVLTCGLSFPLVLLLDVLKHVFFFFSIFYPFMGQKTDLLITHLKSIYNPITWEISDLKGNRHDKEWIC